MDKLPMLEKNLIQPNNTKENSLDIFKTLFDTKDIITKTELTQEQIVLINKKLLIAELLDFQELKDAIYNFMTLQVSKDRKGRFEFVDGLKNELHREENKNIGFVERMRGMFQ